MSKVNNSVDYTQKVLEVKNLKKYFFVGKGKGKLTIPAVDDVSFDVYKREVFGLVGESGCGKTTTGRTIIKLYNPTDGTVDLNGIRIGAGFSTHVQNIKKLKEEYKERVSKLDEYKYQLYLIDQEAKQKIEFVSYDIDKIKNEQIAKTKAENDIIEEYHHKKYDFKSIYRLDTERIKYDFLLKKHEIEAKTKNPSLTEYKNELEIAKNKFNNKTEGIKESAALTDEVKEQRMKKLKELYHQEVIDLKNNYEPLIEKDEANKLPSKDAKEQILKFKHEMTAKLHERKHKFDQEFNALKAPDFKKIKENIKAIKAEAKEKMLDVKKQISDIKEEAKVKKVQLPKIAVDPSKVTEINEQKKVIKDDINQRIQFEKDQIRTLKEINKSKDSLIASRKMQMIFQDPISSLNPRMTVKEIVGEGLTILGGYSDEEITERVNRSLELVGLVPEYAARYPHEFSGGQRQRIGVARALIMNPNFIIADEPISSLDVSIRAQVINLLTNLKEELGLTILFIAHDLSVVRFFCDRIAVMYFGKLVELASSKELFKNPMHPYTISLLSAIPQPDPDYEKGRTRINYNPAQHDYRVDKPKLRELAPGHSVYANDKEFEEMKKKYDKNNPKNPNTKQSPEKSDDLGGDQT